MDYVNLKTSLFLGGKSFCILVLGVIVLLGWLILLLAGVQLLGTYLPALTPIVTEWQKTLTGCFITTLHYPLVVLFLLVLGSYLLHRFGWDTWF